MAQAALWLCACFLLAWLLRQRPVHAVALVLALWVCVPAVAGHHLTGLEVGSLAFHPATWLVAAVLAVQLVVNPGPLADSIGKHVFLFLSLSVFIVGATVTSLLQDSGGTRLLFDQIVAPVLLFFLVVSYATDLSKLLLLRNVILALATAESALAIAQYATQRVIFYESDFLKLYWFHPTTIDRWMGTTEGALVLSVFLCGAAALALSVRSWSLKLALLVWFLLGVLITQSRTGTAAMAVIIGYGILRANTVLWKRLLSLLAIAVAGYVISTSLVASGLITRFTNDAGSANARVRALQFLYGNGSDYALLGRGLTSSYRIARDFGLQTSLESSYLMYLVDTGVVLATLYFGAQLWLLVASARQRVLPGLALAAGSACLLQHTFSGVAASNLTGSLIWCSLGMLVAAAQISHRSADRAGQALVAPPAATLDRSPALLP